LVLVGAAVLAGVTLSGADGQRPSDKAAQFVRSSAASYVNVATNMDGDQWKRARSLLERLPTLEVLRSGLLQPRVESALAGLNLGRDVRPWLGDEAALAQVPLGSQGPQPLLLLSTTDEAASRKALERAGYRPVTVYRGVDLRSAGPRVAAVKDGFVVIGTDEVVRRALDVHDGVTPALVDEQRYDDLRDGLPDDRLAHAYVSQALLQTTLAGPAAILAGTARSPELQAGVFAISLEKDRGRLSFRGTSRGDIQGGGGCQSEVKDASSLLEQAPPEPAALLGLSRVECLARAVADAPAEAGTGAALRRFLSEVKQRQGVDLERELLSLLKGESALVVSPGDPAPVITFVVNGVDDKKALEVLGRLQPAILDLVQPQRVGRTAAFSARELDGVNVLTADLGPGLQLSYAAFDGKLVVSTSLNGIRAARQKKGPEETDDFKLVLDDRPEKPSAVLFLDFDKLLALADQVGLDANPAYLAVRDDLQKLGAVGAFVSREGEDINAELLFKNP